MSVNWVTLNDNKQPIPLPREEFVFQQITRLSMVCRTINKTPGARIEGAAEAIYLSAQRVIFLSNSDSSQYHIDGKGDANFENISIPLSNFKGAKLHQPWIGPNAWIGAFTPTPSGGLDPELAMWEIKISFPSGGAFEFAKKFEQAMRAESLNQSHIDELPQYVA